MLQPMKRREILLMLLPVMALGGFGFYAGTRHNEMPSDGPSRVIIADVKQVPVTPRNAALGYDRTFRVALGSRGRRPDDWGEAKGWSFSDPSVFYEQQGRRIRLNDELSKHVTTRVGYGMAHFDPANRTYNMDLDFDLRHIPATYGEIRFDTTIGFESYRNGQTIPERRRTPLLLTLRRAGEIIPQPIVSKYCPLTVARVEVHDLTATPTAECLVAVVLHSLEPMPTFAPNGLPIVMADATHLEDHTGKYYHVDCGWSPSTNGNDCTLMWNIPKRTIPTVPGPVTFKSKLSMNDGWPLPIAVVIRKK